MHTGTMTAALATNPELCVAQNAANLFRAHAAFVASFLYRLGLEPSEIEDAVQEVFLIAHRQGGYHPGPAQPRTWLAAIAIRVAMKAKTRHRRGGPGRQQPPVPTRIPAAPPGVPAEEGY